MLRICTSINISRTGRAGRPTAPTRILYLVCPKETRNLQKNEKKCIHSDPLTHSPNLNNGAGLDEGGNLLPPLAVKLQPLQEQPVFVGRPTACRSQSFTQKQANSMGREVNTWSTLYKIPGNNVVYDTNIFSSSEVREVPSSCWCWVYE